ncbi:MAG: ATP-binding protein [Bacteroidota bacterium]
MSFLVLGPFSFAQTVEEVLVQNRSFGQQELLGASPIRKAFQDQSGFYWLASINEFFRFDGRKFTGYPNELFGIGDGETLQTLTDTQGRIWVYAQVVTSNIELVYRKGSLRILGPGSNISPPISLSSFLPTAYQSHDAIMSLIEDEGRLFLILNWQLVFEWEDGQFQLLFDAGAAANLRTIVWFSALKKYFYLSNGNLYSFDPDQQTSHQILLPRAVYGLKKDDNVLFLPASGGQGIRHDYIWYHPMSETSTIFHTSSILHYLAKDGRNQWCFQQGDQLFLMESQPSGQLDTILLGPREEYLATTERIEYASYLNGNYWFFFHRFAEQVKFQKPLFQCYLQTESPTSIRDIHPINDSLLLLATYNGVELIEFAGDDVISTNISIDSSTPFGIAAAPDSTLWLGTHNWGVNKLDLRTSNLTSRTMGSDPPTLNKSPAYLPFYGADERLWMGMGNGLGQYLPEQNLLIAPDSAAFAKLRGHNIRWVGPAAGIGRFWLATDRGGYLLDTKTRQIIDSLSVGPERSLNAIIPVGEDSIWVLPNGDDIYLWKKNVNDWDTLALFHPEWQNNFHALVPDRHGSYWLPSDNGLFRYHTATQQVTRYTEADGLPSNEFNRVAWEHLADGRIAFGSIKGLVIVDPSDFANTSMEQGPPQMQITSISYVLRDSSIQVPDTAYLQLTQALLLPAETRQLRIDFDWLTPTSSELRYFYRVVDGKRQPSWTELETGTIVLNQLRYGRQLVQLAVMKKESASFDVQIDLALNVGFPWYLSWWSMLLAVGLIIGIVQLILRYRLYQIHQKNLQLQQLVEERTAIIKKDQEVIAAQNEELQTISTAKDKLFGLLGHELRAPLMGVIGLSKKASYLLRKNRLADLEKMSNQLDRYAVDTQDMLQNLLNWGQVMTGEMDPETEELHLPATVGIVLQKLSDKITAKSIKIVTDFPPEAMVCFDSQALKILLRNLLDNAIKFSFEGGTIQIVFLSGTDLVGWRLEIKDEGIGMPDHMLSQQAVAHSFYSRSGTSGEKGSGLGLNLCRELARQNAATLTFQSNSPRGTIAIVRALVEK